MSRHFILYASDARLPDEPAERLVQLCSILSRARRHNNPNQVNGYLALVGNPFIRILKGDSAVLLGIMLRIGIDHRLANPVVREKGKSCGAMAAMVFGQGVISPDFEKLTTCGVAVMLKDVFHQSFRTRR